MIAIRQTDVFSEWLRGLRDRQATLIIQARIVRLAKGNPGDVKPVGEGVSELRISHGPAIASISFSAAGF
jgi:putative addiction module killer protein